MILNMSAYSRNKKATLNYEVIERYDAGISLLGFEVKSIKKGQADLTGSYVTIRGNEAFLIGLTIPPFQVNNTPIEYDPLRVRKLLLNKKEILKLTKLEKGLTLIPLSLYNKGGIIKLEFAVARGKKKKDKREDIKKKEAKKDIERSLKSQR